MAANKQAGKKSFKELYASLEKTRQSLEEQRQKEAELQKQLGPALDAEIIKLVRAKYKSDADMFNLLQDIQDGKVEITFTSVKSDEPESGDNVPDAEQPVQDSFLTGGEIDDTNE